MDFFYIFLLLAIGAVGGYMIGHDAGKQEGYIDACVKFYKANR